MTVGGWVTYDSCSSFTNHQKEKGFTLPKLLTGVESAMGGSGPDRAKDAHSERFGPSYKYYRPSAEDPTEGSSGRRTPITAITIEWDTRVHFWVVSMDGIVRQAQIVPGVGVRELEGGTTARH